MNFTWETVNAFLAQHHVVPLAVLLVGLYRVVRPVLLDVRAVGVEIVSVVRASAKKAGVTSDDIEAERPAAEKALPSIPDVPSLGAAIKVISDHGEK